MKCLAHFPLAFYTGRVYLALRLKPPSGEGDGAFIVRESSSSLLRMPNFDVVKK